MGLIKEKKYFTIVMRVDEETKILIEQYKELTGLSEREILGHSSRPCDCCKNMDVIAYNSKNKEVGIKRGILFKSLLKKYSTYNQCNKP